MLLRFEKHEESSLPSSPSPSYPPSPRDNHQVMLISHHDHFSFPPPPSLSLSYLSPSVVCHPSIYRINASSCLWASALCSGLQLVQRVLYLNLPLFFSHTCMMVITNACLQHSRYKHRCICGQNFIIR